MLPRLNMHDAKGVIILGLDGYVGFGSVSGCQPGAPERAGSSPNTRARASPNRPSQTGTKRGCQRCCAETRTLAPRA